ncbi:DUF1697 domain-containing protein [Flavobacterium sp.]|uniref:DUF1697 domain-containing protein n=1 Tax=Flavobacterium sp. TaxID=239 RepID=UPI0012145A0A|nr:DUF1697 domain-containing protein [Flavobacterium sp.]RZJ72846.1 MAG: DUF1697 domain-containing protein [Flavobacterium sp.]
MNKYIALLRGINVSGQKLIKMEALRESLKNLGLKDVSTYIQSGNVLFVSDDSASDLQQNISRMIKADFGFDVSVIVVTPDDLAVAVAENPFAGKTPEGSTQPYIGFLSEIPTSENLKNLSDSDFGSDEWIVIGKRIYLWYADSAANTKLSNAVIERKLKLISTARNWKTTNKLILLSS